MEENPQDRDDDTQATKIDEDVLMDQIDKFSLVAEKLQAVILNLSKTVESLGSRLTDLEDKLGALEENEED